MTKEQKKVLSDLRRQGYAVITWTPEELRGADPGRVQDRSIEIGHEIIDDLAGPEQGEEQ